MSDLAHQVVAAVDILDEYISSIYSEEDHEASFGCSPALYCDYKTLEKREKFCNLTEGGKRVFMKYQNSIAAVDDNAGGKSHIYLRLTGVRMLVILTIPMRIG
eukprot:5260761-Ditylum_brightwellii.AAC.1